MQRGDFGPNLDVLAVNEALEELARLDERQARIAELRFFAGLTNKEIAQLSEERVLAILLPHGYTRQQISRLKKHERRTAVRMAQAQEMADEAAAANPESGAAAAAAAEPSAAEVRSALELELWRKQLAALLASAEEAFEADRLVSPPGDNALERFESVLAIDAQNEEADAGIRRIAERHVELAEKDIAAYNFDQAESLIDQANTIYAGIPSIATAHAARARAWRAARCARARVASPPPRPRGRKLA